MVERLRWALCGLHPRCDCLTFPERDGPGADKRGFRAAGPVRGTGLGTLNITGRSARRQSKLGEIGRHGSGVQSY